MADNLDNSNLQNPGIKPLDPLMYYGVIMKDFGTIAAAYDYHKYITQLKSFAMKALPEDKEKIKGMFKPVFNLEHTQKMHYAIETYKRIAPPEMLDKTQAEIKKAEEMLNRYLYEILGIRADPVKN
jgi:hypothetical protein